jgi:hypothetical protein
LIVTAVVIIYDSNSIFERRKAMTDMCKPGESANLEDKFESMMNSLKWKGFNENGQDIVPDLDIAILATKKDGSKSIFCFASQGNRNAPDFILMSEDAGVEGEDKQPIDVERVEKASVFSLDPYNYLDLIAWDWGAIKDSHEARFDKAAAHIEVKTYGAGDPVIHDITLDSGDLKRGANVSWIARIDNTSEMGPKVVNMSKSCMLATAPTKTPQMVEMLSEGLAI